MLIDFPVLLQKHKFKPKGILHCGSNSGQERFWYADAGVDNVIWIEAIPSVYEVMKNNVSVYPKNIPLNACISETDNDTVVFNVSSNEGESSSIFDFDLHSKFHPEVTFVDTLQLTTTRIDTLINRNKINIRNYDYLSCDLQGSELAALKSMGDMLRLFKYVYIEVNKTPLYANIPLVNEIDEYLLEFGFVAVDEKYTGAGWGDKFYIKDEKMQRSVFAKAKKNVNKKVISIPDIFTVPDANEYPKWNTPDFEYWLSQNINDSDITSDRIYLPVLFTAYHKRYSYGKNKAAIDNLQNYINGLDKTKKYFTVVQYDDGTLIDWGGLDIMIFAMSGEPNKEDYPMPLICQPFKTRFNTEKKYLANFVGRITHPLRTKMIAALNHKQGYYISTYKHVESDYHQILAESTFSLCPRGYGKNSFRIMESIYQGSIPVYVSDEFILPHNIDFEKYGVIIKESEIDNIDEILRAIPEREVKSKQAELQKTFDVIYSFEANKKYILNIVN